MAKRPNKNKLGKEKCSLGILGWVILAIFAVYTLFLLIPYAYAAFASISNYKEYYLNIFPFPSDGIKWENYVDAWNNLMHEGNSVPEMILNSLWFAGGSAILNVFLSSCGAYICAKYKFRGRKFLYWFALITMMIPVVGSMPSQLKFISNMGVYNSRMYIFVNAATIGATFIIMYSCFKNLDWSYAEAAFMDGAGHFTVFFKIMLPQVISPMTALILSDFIMGWTDVESSLVYYPELPTLSTGLYHFRSFVITVEGMRRYPAYFAAILLCIIPTVALFAIFQKKLMDIQLSGGIKG